MQRALMIATVAALTGALGCAQPDPKASGDVAADREAITALREREIALFGAGNVDDMLAVFTDDLVIMAPNEAAIVGKEAARSWFQSIVQQFKIEGTYTSASDLTINGDWAFERMTYKQKLTPTGGGAAIEDVGKGVHVYRRQADGSWKIAQDIWNSDTPVPASQ